MIVSIDVSNNGISGTIAPELSNMTALRFLNLSSNHYGGAVDLCGFKDTISQVRENNILSLVLKIFTVGFLIHCGVVY